MSHHPTDAAPESGAWRRWPKAEPKWRPLACGLGRHEWELLKLTNGAAVHWDGTSYRCARPGCAAERRMSPTQAWEGLVREQDRAAALMVAVCAVCAFLALLLPWLFPLPKP